MNRLSTFASLACMMGALLLTGCESLPLGGANKATTGHAGTSGAAPASATPAGLKEGIAMYNNGDYNDAIKRLGAADVTGGSKATQLAAMKYTAFSYCVTSRQTLCRQQFDKALKLDPSFDLEPGEHGHPLWGPVFTKAKKGK
jgi:hypothetical protein